MGHRQPNVADRADVVVVGAGPAGTAAAIHLARAGRRVVVFDRARFPRDKCCGDGLTTLALRELEPLGLRPEAVPSWTPVEEALVRAPGGREVRLPLPGTGTGTFAAVAARRDLDAALVELASAAGADVREGHQVGGVDVDRDHIVVEGVRAATLIAADGVWSPVRRLLGLDEQRYLGEWHAARQYVDGVDGPAAEQLHVWFDHDLGAGYAWSFPLGGGRANVGFGVQRSHLADGHHARRLWQDILQRPYLRSALGPGATFAGRMTAWPIPGSVDRAVLAHGRTLFVGDAARAADVLTGEGIGQALLTGRLAAEAVLARDAARPQQVAAAYRRSVRAHLLADHRVSAALVAVGRHPRFVDLGIGIAARSDWSRHAAARWMFEDAPRHTLLTPWRWHRDRQPRPAPFAS